MTKPSRSDEKGRLAPAGSSLRVDIAFIAEKPAKVIGRDRRLGATRHHDVGVAVADVAAASPMACAEDAQADTVA
jgi:hypothetical protein